MKPTIKKDVHNKNSKIESTNNLIKDRLLLILTALLISLFLISSIFLQLATNLPWFNYVAVILGGSIFTYYSYYSVKDYYSKNIKNIFLNLFVSINGLILAVYLFLVVFDKVNFGFGNFVHGLIMVAEIFIFSLIVGYFVYKK
ncbi:MAG: hypothetical protein JXR81_00830 [Candidatus Goldbacteria bacterium]|nr:hypothetical protein [Candidatus Goldiibacteriota bacterium]